MIDLYREPPKSYRLGCAEFYSAETLFAVETFLIEAPSAGEALALARRYAEQSAYFNLAVPDLVCLVRVKRGASG